LRAVLGLDNIYLLKVKESRIPDIGQDRAGIGAQAAVFTREERDPARLKKSEGRPHGLV
jgi:hypothetical protein